MAGNRKLPFGYRMELGEIVVHPQEASVVSDIFRQYILGASYKVLVEQLRKQAVPYDHGRLWNKNMVARILEDKRYTGAAGWPVLIAGDEYCRAVEKRSGKVAPPQITGAQKVLRRLSGGSAAKDLEKRVLRLLNRLITEPEIITAPQSAAAGSSWITELQLSLEYELGQQPVNEDAAEHLVMEIASAQYNLISNQEYETERLRRLFTRYPLMETLDTELLGASVSAIKITGRKISVWLKNGQVLEEKAP